MQARICRYEAVGWSFDELRRVGHQAGAALGGDAGLRPVRRARSV
jgi:hypothetical protein